MFWIAIGIQTQWGVGVSSASGTTTLTYHLAYSNFAAVFTGNTSGDKSTSPVNMTNVGLSSCRIHVKDDARYYADSFNWFALGFQQWGKSLTAESKASVTFPIAFERIVYFVDVFSLEAGRPCLFTKSHPITTNGFYWEYNYHGDDVGVQWLAIGV